jgi:hypothetical protein
MTGDAWADTDKRYTGSDGVSPPDMEWWVVYLVILANLKNY